MAAGTEPQREWVLRVLGLDVGAASAEGSGAVVRLAQGMIRWNQTRSYVGQQIRTLKDAIRAATDGMPDHEEICANLGNLEEILEVLDDRLTGALNAMRGTTDTAEKAKLSEQARRIVKDYEAYLASNELVNEIDANGFVALDIKPTVAKALTEVSAMI